MSWLNNLAYTYIGDYPLIMYLGILAYSLFLITGAIPLMNRRGWTRISLKYHIRLAYISAALATIHGLMAVSGYIG